MSLFISDIFGRFIILFLGLFGSRGKASSKASRISWDSDNVGGPFFLLPLFRYVLAWAGWIWTLCYFFGLLLFCLRERGGSDWLLVGNMVMDSWIIPLCVIFAFVMEGPVLVWGWVLDVGRIWILFSLIKAFSLDLVLLSGIGIFGGKRVLISGCVVCRFFFSEGLFRCCFFFYSI
jgi:hypothetical protein